MNRYLVFLYDDYYPSGGAYDLVWSFDKFEEALNFAKKQREHESRINIIDIEKPFCTFYEVYYDYDFNTKKTKVTEVTEGWKQP